MSKLCTAYDQISDRSCRYDDGHGGKHNFARLDHNTTVERELRRRLDMLTTLRNEACDLALRVLRGQEQLDGPSLRWLIARFDHLRQWDSDIPTDDAEFAA